MEMINSPPTSTSELLCELCDYRCSKERDYKIHIGTAKHKKIANGNNMEIKNSPLIIKKKILCEVCNYKCSKESEYKKHINSQKHIKNIDNKNLNECDSNLNCIYCKKYYKTLSGLWKHNKTCGMLTPPTENSVIKEESINDSSANEMKVLTNLVLELVKSNTDLQKQMLDVCKNNQPTTIISNNNNNNNNKTFNLQVFLNEECKDAMNLKDFVNSFKLQLSDLELVGDEGFINGMTKVILAKLDGMDANTRPFHCTDLKRETVYVKEDDVWVREGPENSKLAAAIKAIGHQNFFILKEYKALHPDCESTYSEFNDHYMNLIMKSAGCQKEDIAKVIKKLVKEIVIIKS
jgi:hypothetical protein